VEAKANVIANDLPQLENDLAIRRAELASLLTEERTLRECVTLGDSFELLDHSE